MHCNSTELPHPDMHYITPQKDSHACLKQHVHEQMKYMILLTQNQIPPSDLKMSSLHPTNLKTYLNKRSLAALYPVFLEARRWADATENTQD